MKIKQKIFNDPVYGFIAIPSGIILDIIDHPYLQRLRRIKQTGLTHLVYPGALHTRFHHTLGALHLMMLAIQVLRSKGVLISKDEETAVCLAILLHDIGHGPFSHALENKIIQCHHEDISLYYMKYFNELYDGQLDLAIQIFTKKYTRKFLSQLVSGQLDMDRMDYLNRDSFYTGVIEGVIGHDRIIKMLDVRDNILVIEEKGIYSIEKFLVSRRLMYWQVYLHKTSVAGELMLKNFWKRLQELYTLDRLDINLNRFKDFFDHQINDSSFESDFEGTLALFSKLDDFDINFLLKDALNSRDFILQTLAYGILNRRLYRLSYNSSIDKDAQLQKIHLRLKEKQIKLSNKEIEYFIFEGSERTNIYEPNGEDEIMILKKDDSIVPFSSINQLQFQLKTEEKKYLCSIRL